MNGPAVTFDTCIPNQPCRTQADQIQAKVLMEISMATDVRSRLLQRRRILEYLSLDRVGL